MWNNDRNVMNTEIFKRAVLLFATVLLTACGGLTQSDKPATSTWLLKPYESSSRVAPADTLPRVSVTLTVVPGLDTDKILTLSADSELNHFTGADWADNLPELLHSTISRSLQASGRFNVVPANTSAGLDECILSLELQEFYAVGNDVQVSMVGEYACSNGESTPINAKSSSRYQESRINTIVATFQTATDKAMQDILNSIPNNRTVIPANAGTS